MPGRNRVIVPALDPVLMPSMRVGVVAVIAMCSDLSLGDQTHAALRTIPWLARTHLGVHGTCVDHGLWPGRGVIDVTIVGPWEHSVVSASSTVNGQRRRTPTC